MWQVIPKRYSKATNRIITIFPTADLHPHRCLTPGHLQVLPTLRDTKAAHEDPSKALLNLGGFHCFPLTCRGSHCRRQPGWSGKIFFFDSTMLAVSNYLEVFHMARKSLNENLLFNVLRERGEADQCLVPWIPFLAFFFFSLNTVMFVFFQSSGLSMLTKITLVVTSVSSLNTISCLCS